MAVGVETRSPARWPRGRTGGASRNVTTGAKVFLILSIALLPLALIAVVATLQTGRLADQEVRARLRVAADESARALGIELIGDMTALRAASRALARDPADAPSCARAQGVFGQRSAVEVRFAILDRDGRLLCGRPVPAPGGEAVRAAPFAAAFLPDRGLILEMGRRGEPRTRAFFSSAFLARVAEPSPGRSGTDYAQGLLLGQDRLALSALPGTTPLTRLETARGELGFAGLSLRTSVPSAPITSSFVVALLLPLLMWAAAAGITWLVVDRLLIDPLRRLRASVAAYRPGEVIEPEARAVPAQEIRELGETFRAISRTVALHEQGLAEGLVRQTKLTREVHHRVKNNLQVISSLINFHARGAPTPEATTAYASIQRRVDALAVVHRNHFAEMEDNRGLPLRSVLGELASNIRATAPQAMGSQAGASAGRLGIVLDIDNYLVGQDTGVAVAFLVTELVELAMTCDPAAQVRVSLKPADEQARARLRIVSRALTDSDELRDLMTRRYGRIVEGLSRQMRSRLHHDPLSGAYEIDLIVLGRD